MSRKCEYGVLEITSDTKVLLSHESQTSDLTKDFCFTRDFQNPILTFPHSQHWHCWKLQISNMKKQMKWDIFLKEMKFLSILVNVLTCDYIDFYCHMWENWTIKRTSPFICIFLSLVCISQQCKYCECGNVSIGFWKS